MSNVVKVYTMAKGEPRTGEKEPEVIYRVFIDPSLGDAKIMAIGLVGVGIEDPLEGHYSCVGELPVWVQEKIAVLMMLDPPDGPIDGVGRRIDRNVFWVYP